MKIQSADQITHIRERKKKYLRHKEIKITGKSFSEALILAVTNPQYDKRLFIELSTSSVHENYKLRTCCVLIYIT